MKNKNKNKNRKQGKKAIALALMLLMCLTMIPSFAMTGGGGSEPPTSEKAKDEAKKEIGEGNYQSPFDVWKIMLDTIKRFKQKQDKLTNLQNYEPVIQPTIPQIVQTEAEKAAGVRPGGTITHDISDLIPGIEEAKLDVKTKTDDEIESWPDKLKKLRPGYGRVNLYDKGLDWVFTTLSVVMGIARGYALAKIKGSCSAEESLKGLNPMEQEEACKSCNSDPYRLCTLQRCMILGNCIPIAPEEGTGTAEEMSDYICIPGKCEETGVVGFESVDVIFYSGGQELAEHKYEDKDIPLTLTKQVPFNSDSVNIEIETDKLAQCRYSFEAQQDYDSMIDFDNNYYPGTYDEPENQDVTIMLPGTMPRNQQHTVYIKCNNVCGVAHDKNDDNHFVRFTFEEKPDQLPPIIVYMDPNNAGAVSGDLTTLFSLQFNLDENGYCKYSDNYTIDTNNNPAPLTKDWNDMVTFGETQYGTDSAVTGGQCTDNQECPDLRDKECAHCFLELDLTKGYTEYDWEQLSPELQEELGLEETTKFFRFMIRCADSRENKMTEENTLDYSFFVIPPYEMELIKPEDYSSTYEINPEIEVTSTRNTNCRYQTLKLTDGATSCPRTLPDWEDMIDIDGTFDKEHFGEVQEDLEPSIQGTPYCMYVKCRDQWILERYDYHFFKLFQDVYNPKIIRMYHDIFAGDYLLIETDEDATCVYGTDDEIECNYAFNEGTAMTGTNSTIHTAYWSLDHLYYIRCQDQWGNVPSKGICTAIINPFEIPTFPF